MKKILVLICAGLLAGSSAMAQGSFGAVLLNNYDSGKGIFNQNGTTPAPAGTIIEVLGGANAGSLSVIASTTGGNKYTIGAADINGNGPGSGSFFDFGFGTVNGVAVNGPATLLVRAWLGAQTYDAALTRGSVTWTQNTGNPGGGTPPAPPSPATLAMPGTLIMQTIPEPSAIVLGILGAGALLLRRRK